MLSLHSIFSSTLGWNRLGIIKNYRDIRKWQKRSEKGHRHMWIAWPYLAKVLQPAKGKGREEVGCFWRNRQVPWTHVSRKEETERPHIGQEGVKYSKKLEQLAKLWLKKGYSNTDPVWIQYSKYKKHPKKLLFNQFVSLWQKGSIHSSSTLHLLPTHGRSDPGQED